MAYKYTNFETGDFLCGGTALQFPHVAHLCGLSYAVVRVSSRALSDLDVLVPFLLRLLFPVKQKSGRWFIHPVMSCIVNVNTLTLLLHMIITIDENRRQLSVKLSTRQIYQTIIQTPIHSVIAEKKKT